MSRYQRITYIMLLLRWMACNFIVEGETVKHASLSIRQTANERRKLGQLATQLAASRSQLIRDVRQRARGKQIIVAGDAASQ